jgi:hypothetical protein
LESGSWKGHAGKEEEDHESLLTCLSDLARRPDHIFSMLGSLLMTRVHPEIDRNRGEINHKGMDKIEQRVAKLTDFGNKTAMYRTSLV